MRNMARGHLVVMVSKLRARRGLIRSRYVKLRHGNEQFPLVCASSIRMGAKRKLESAASPLGGKPLESFSGQSVFHFLRYGTSWYVMGYEPPPMLDIAKCTPQKVHCAKESKLREKARAISRVCHNMTVPICIIT